jgi:STE24 endopeptidase
MESVPAHVDPDRQVQAREYARIRRCLLLLDLLLGGLYLVAWVFTDVDIILRDYIITLINPPWLVVLVYAAVLVTPYLLLNTPLSYFSGYILPHRFGQSTQSRLHWVGDQLKGLLLSSFFGGFLLSLIYMLLRQSPDLWWLYAGGIILVFSVVLSTLVPVLIAPLFFKFVPLEDETLNERLLRLAKRAGIATGGVYRFDMSARTKGANAAVMGLGATRRIILGDTLLDSFAYDEIETIIAHEMGHLAHKDILLAIAFDSILVLGSLRVIHSILLAASSYFDLMSMADPAGLPLLGLITGTIGLIAMPAGNAFSRWRERMADRFAVELTGKGQAFASALRRLANQNLGEIDPEPWVVFLLYSHPPLGMRIVTAEAYPAERHGEP